MVGHEHGAIRLGKSVIHFVTVIVGAFALTLAFFLVLPLIQTINKPPGTDMLVTLVSTAYVPPPPAPPEEEEPEEEEEKEPEPPELEEEMPPLDLAQLELALNPGFGGEFGVDFKVDLNQGAAGGDDIDALFSMADLDQRPRAVYQPSPNFTAELRRRAPGTVYIIFVVDERGRVTNSVVQSSTDPVFEGPALAAVKQWKFEPGLRNGKAVRFRVRQPIIFPKD
jgi:protein TonB